MNNHEDYGGNSFTNKVNIGISYHKICIWYTYLQKRFKGECQVVCSMKQNLFYPRISFTPEFVFLSPPPTKRFIHSFI